MTSRQELATQIVVESYGKGKPVSIGEAMVKGGYSKASAKNPKVLTTSKAYQDAMAKLRNKYGVTLDKYMRNLGEGMEATNEVANGYEIVEEGKKKYNRPVFKKVPNVALRLAANKQAEKVLQIDAMFGDGTGPPVSPEDLSALASVSDEVQLTQLLFRKNNS